ncbi:hypothetical protein FOL47_006456 [Perkinsus chesapeaki]|uniref:ferric-chelate reductase (NADPH) n=1 Tax=Perkinsus chesapeaki TaxID=330153 RepID=A0A7J6MYN5_PERCH|nr:hypothetical protein FOL47_006456 [Perkinsus chesapeaki]
MSVCTFASPVDQHIPLFIMHWQHTTIISIFPFLPRLSCYPSYSEVLPFHGACIDGCCTFGHGIATNGFHHFRTISFIDACNSATEDNVNGFGDAFEDSGEVWRDRYCVADSDGDGFSNGDELGDPCCIYNYWRAHGKPTELGNLLYPDQPSPIATPLSVAGVKVSRAASGYIVEWADALKDSEECVCTVVVRYNNGDQLTVPWGQRHAVIPNNISEIRLASRNLFGRSPFSDSLPLGAVGPEDHPTRYDEALTMDSPDKPRAPSQTVDDGTVVLISPLVFYFGTGLLLFVGGYLLKNRMNQRFLLFLWPSPKECLCTIIGVGAGIGLLFALKAERDYKIFYQSALGHVAALFMAFVITMGNRSLIERVLHCGFEQLPLYHAIFAYLAVFAGIAHGIMEIYITGFAFPGSNMVYAVIALALFGVIILTVLGFQQVKVITYDLFRLLHVVLVTIISFLLILHTINTERSGVAAAIILGVAVLTHVPAKLVIIWRLVRPNFVVKRAIVLGGKAVFLEIEKTDGRKAPFKPGQWAGLSVPSVTRAAEHPFTVIPVSDNQKAVTLVIAAATGGTSTFTRSLPDDLESSTLLWILSSLVKAGTSLEGQRVTLTGPYGEAGVPAALRACSDILFICGGSGITPALSLATATMNRGQQPNVLWIARNKQMIELLSSQLAALTDKGSCKSRDSVGLFVCGPESLKESAFKAYTEIKQTSPALRAFHDCQFRFL